MKTFSFQSQKQINKIHIIKEKNLILIIFYDKIGLYKGKNNILNCSIPFLFQSDGKLLQINSGLFILFNSDNKSYNYNYDYERLAFLHIGYFQDEPKNMVLSTDDILGIGFTYNLTDIDIIDQNNIISIDKHKNIQYFKKILVSETYKTYKKEIKVNKQTYCMHYYIKVDKINNHIIIYFCTDNKLFLEFYDLDSNYFSNISDLAFNRLNNNLNLKKIITFTQNYSFEYYLYNYNNNIKIFLNKEKYICQYRDFFYLISSKYLEMISIIKFKNYPNIYLLNELNKLFIYKNQCLSLYNFKNNKLKLIKEKKIENINIIDIKQINEKGDYMIVVDEFNKTNDFNTFKNNNKHWKYSGAYTIEKFDDKISLIH